MTYRTDFPDFDDIASCKALLDAGWTDRSWGNDCCPSFQSGRAFIMIDYIAPDLSEWWPDRDLAEHLAQRFQICRCKPDGEDLGEWENSATLAESLIIADRYNAEGAE